MDNENKNTSGKGVAEGAAEAVQKIIKLKKTAAIIGTIAPALGFVFLIILAAVLVFMPIISSYSFVGGIFSSSTNNSSELSMPINLAGFAKSDIKIFQDIYDGVQQYKNLDFKEKEEEQIDLALLISTIQNQGIVNFEDGETFDLNKEIDSSESQISNFETIDDFNAYVDKYGIPNTSSSSSANPKYDGESIVDNSQNKSFYQSLGDKGGQVYYIYPGTRKLLGYMISNSISYGSVDYDEWECGDNICNNATEIWSDWQILREITSNNGTNASCNNSGSAWGAICNIQSAITYANDYIARGNSSSWEYKNINYDLEQLKNEVLHTDNITNSVSDIISNLSGNATIPNGVFEVGKSYATVSVKKYLDYSSYEDYAEKVFIKHLYMDCDNCEMKDASDDAKIKQASVIYDNIYSIKELFDYFNDGIINNSSSIDDTSGVGTNSIAYSCSNGSAPNIVSYYGHQGRDLNGVPVGTQVYPLFEGTVVSINNCDVNYAPERHYDSSGSEYYTCSVANAHSCGYGNMVKIQGTAADGVEYYAIYGHLSRIDVAIGDTVSMNTVIGLLGNTGCSTGAHLHLELRKVKGNGFVYADNIYIESSVKSVLCSR